MRKCNVTGKKCKLKKKTGIHYKLCVLLYLSFFIFTHLTSPTTANFNDTEQIDFNISFHVKDKEEDEVDVVVVEEKKEDKSEQDKLSVEDKQDKGEKPGSEDGEQPGGKN